MSETEVHRRVVSRFYEQVYGRGMVEVLEAVCASDVAGTWRGRDVLGTAVTELRATCLDLSVRIERQVAAGDTVATLLSMSGMAAPEVLDARLAGRAVQRTMACFDRLHAGVIHEHEEVAGPWVPWE